MFPSIRSVAITNGTAATTTPVVNLPATVVRGDTIWVVIRSSAANASAIGWPDANWIEVVDDSPDASTGQIAFAWKKAVGNEGGTTITLTSGNNKFAAAAWAVQDAADPTVRPPELSTVATGTSAGQPDATSVLPTGPGARDYLWLTFFGMEGEATGITAYPSNYTLGQSGFANSGTGGAVTTNAIVAGAARTANGTTENAGAWNISGTLDDWSAYTVAFHPATSDLSTSLSESVRTFDRAAGVAIGVASALLAAGMFGETAKLSDNLTAAMDPPPYLETAPTEILRAREWPYGASIGSPTGMLSAGLMEGYVFHLQEELNPIAASVGAEQIKVADALTAELAATLLSGSANESAKADDGGFVELIGLGNPIKISEELTVQLVQGNDLAANVSESLKASEGYLNNGLISYWNLDEASGPRFDSRSINHLTANGTGGVGSGTGVAGTGTAADFESGESDYLNASDNASLSIQNRAFTVAAWCNFESISGRHGIVAHCNNADFSWLLEYNQSSNTFRFIVSPDGTSGGGTTLSATNFGAASVGPWYFVVAWYDSSGMLGISVNDGSPNTQGHLDVFDSSAEFQIGREGDLNNYFDGRIARVGFWKRVLNAQQRTDLYNGGAGRPFLLVTGPSVTLTPEEASFAESLKVVDDNPPSVFRQDEGSLAPSPTPSEALKVVDTVSAQIGLQIAPTAEAVKADDGGLVELRGLGNPIRITDGPVVAQISGGPAPVIETLKIADTVTVRLNPLQTAPTEAFKIADSGEAEISRDETIRIADILTVSPLGGISPSPTPSESLKVVDTVSTSITPEVASPTESLKVVDTVSAAIYLSVNATEIVKVADSAQLTLNPEETSVGESVKVADSIIGPTIDPEQATPSESVKVSDTLSVSLAMELTVSAETVKIADVALVTLNPEQVTVQEETVKVADVVTALLDVNLGVTTENVKITDEPFITLDPEQAASVESVKISDTVVAFIGLGAGPTENIKITDLFTVAIDPEIISTDETVKITDSVFAELQNFDLAPSLLTESLKVADSLSVVKQLGVDVTQESVKTSDTPTVVIQLGVQVADEGVKVADGNPSGYLNPLQISLSEGLSVQDQLLAGAVLFTQQQESAKISDVLTVALDPEEAAKSENVKITETVFVTINPEESTIAESTKIADIVEVSLSTLLVNIGESLKVVDVQPRFGGPRIISVLGGYRGQTVDVVGGYGEGE